MILVAIGYFIPIYGLEIFSTKLPFEYAIMPIVIITLGELLVVPFITLGFYHFSPTTLRGLFMGLYLFVTAIGNSFLFKYAKVYEELGANITFQKIVIHILICAAIASLFWIFIRWFSSQIDNLKKASEEPNA